MNWDQIEGKWDQAKGKIKEKWGKLTDDDITVINGKRANPSSASLQALLDGGCRTDWPILQDRREVTNRCGSGSTWEGAA
jgi:hypothetical protein